MINSASINRPRRLFFASKLYIMILLSMIVALCGCSVAPNAPEEAERAKPVQNAVPAFDNKDIYRDFFGQFYGWDNENQYAFITNQTNKYNAFLADLTHDGADELIVTDDTFGDSIEITIYTVVQDEVRPIFGDISSYEPRAKVFGLYEKDGSTYMLVCENNMWQNGGDCSYRAFSLTPTGEKNILLQDMYAEHYDPESGEVSEAYYDFLARQDSVLRQARVLFDCDDDYVLQSDPAAVLD